MSATEFDPPEAAHGFFHTLVVMGSALALGCGGISHDTPTSAPTGGSGGSGDRERGGATGTSGAGGGPLGTSGGSSGSGGNMMSSGGAGNIIMLGGAGGSGGAASGLDAGAAGELACPPEQWRCTMALGCSVVSLPPATGCSCDYTLPTSPKDCDPGASFVCRAAKYDSRGNALAQPEPYECHCIPSPMECQTMCKLAFGEQARCLDAGQQIPTDTTLCDCAMIVLR